MNTKEILEKLEEIKGNQFGRASATDGRLPKEYYELEFVVAALEKAINQLTALTKPVYSDCSIPTSYCSNCSCGKKEALENENS